MLDKLLRLLLRKILSNMATKDEVKSAIATAVEEVKTELKAAIDAEVLQVDAALKALQDQIDAGQPFTSQDLDEVRASVKSISTTVLPEVDAIKP